jgi:hypothetical protein
MMDPTIEFCLWQSGEQYRVEGAILRQLNAFR